MEEKNDLIENKKTNFMDGFKYDIGNMFVLGAKHTASILFASDARNDLEIKNKLQEFLESGNKKESVNIDSVNLIFKKLIEQNCIIGKKTISYLCGLCSKKQNDNKGNLVSENDLILILLKAEYMYSGGENNNQGKPKIRKCILTNDLFEEIIEKIEKKEIGPDNIKHIFELVGNIVGGLFSTKNQIDEEKILDMIKQFGKENTLDVLCDFFIKGDLSIISTKITFAFAGFHNSIPDLTIKNLPSYSEFFDRITKTGAQSETINLIDFVNDIKTVYEKLISNQLDKVKEEDKLKWYKLHRGFVFSILNGILLNVINKAPKEEKQEEEQKFVTSLSNKMEELFVGKRKNNNEQVNIINKKVGENNDNKEINIINDEVEKNDDYDFIGAMLKKIYDAVESVLTIDDKKITELTVNKSADGELEFVEQLSFFSFFATEHKFKITDFLKAIWGKLENKEKNYLKVLILPIAFKMFGKENWKKEILMHGLKIFGLGNFDQIDNKNLDLIFESAVKIIDHLPNDNDKNNEESKKEKISAVSKNLKNIIDVLCQANKNKNLEQIKDSVDSLIDILFLLPKEFKNKDGKINFAQIKEFLSNISKDKAKLLSAVNSMLKLFCSDENFLINLIDGIFDKDSWQANVLKHGLKLFGVSFNNLKDEDLESILESVAKIINHLPNDNDKNNEESKKEKISAVSQNLKNIIDVLCQANKNKNLEQIKNSVDSLIDILFSLPNNFKNKDGKINFDQIKEFLNNISKDKAKLLSAVNSMLKLFCSDENFLINLIDGIFDKDSWQANVLKHGLKLFGVRFDQLKEEDLNSVLTSVTTIMDNLQNKEDKDDQKKQKISTITEATRKIFSVLLVGKNENKNFNGLAQNLIDILLNDDLSQVEMIDKIKDILSVVKSNFVDENNLNVFKCFVKAFLNNGDFLLGIVNGVETLKPVIKNNKVELEGLTDENRDKNWFVPVLDNLGKFLINDIDASTKFIDHINKILDVYKKFAQAIDIPANAECCKQAFSKLKNSSILQKINAVDPVKEKYNALKNFFEKKDKLVHDQDDFKKLEELYNDFMEAFNASNIILTEDEPKKFNEFRFTFEINQTEAVNSVTNILSTVKDILSGMPANKQQENLACVKELLKSVIKDGRILKFITRSDKLKPIHQILSNAFEQLAKLVEIKIDGIYDDDIDSLKKFISDDEDGLLDLLNKYKKFAEALDADSKNNPDYQTNIIDSLKDMIDCVEKKFLVNEKQESQTAYQNLLKAFFSSVEAETSILTFVIDKINDKVMPETSKTALKKSLACLMPLVKNSVGKENFKNNLFELFNSYKALAKELDKSFNLQAAKNFVGNKYINNKYAGNTELKKAFEDLSQEINMLVPDTKKIMHQYKLLRNKIQEVSNTGNKSFELAQEQKDIEVSNTGNKSFELAQEQKDIFEKFELDQSKAIPAIKNILTSISNFCPSDKEIKNENNIINEDDIDKKKDVLVNSSMINIDTDNKNDELNNDNEKSFNKVLINLLQGGDFLKDIINGIDSEDNADMSSDLKNYLANLSSPLCEFLISYIEQTKDSPKEIIEKFDFILSKYIEFTSIIQAEKVDVAKLFKSVGELLCYLEDKIVSKDQTIFESYKNLFKNIVAQTDNGVNESIICLLAKTIKQNLTNEQREETGKYLDFVDECTAPIFTQVASLICENASDYNFFSKFISKFEKAYSIFNTKKSFATAVKSLFPSGNENNNKTLEFNLDQNTVNKDENQIFKYIINQLEFERPVNQIENKKINTTDNLAPQDNLINEDIIKLPLNNENIISTSSKLESNLINDEKEGRKNDGNNHGTTIYLSETLFTPSNYSHLWFLKRWLNQLKDFVKTKFVKKYFLAFKKYIQDTKYDDEILKTLKNKVDLTNPIAKYVTFWRITNLLFWRESKWYYPVVVGEIILSLTIFLPFIVIAGLYSLAKYFWTWLFQKNDKPPIPPGDLPPQLENSQVQNNSILINTVVEKNKADKSLVVNNIKKENHHGDGNNIITLDDSDSNKTISWDSSK